MTPDSKGTDSSGDTAGTLSSKKGNGDRVKVKGWPGYVRGGVFVIEKRIGRKKFHKSTRCTSLRAALKQLERFEADPSAYDPATAAADGALVLDEKLIDEFHAWHLEHVSRPWALDVRRLLVEWANHFRGADLRRLSLVRHIEPHLKDAAQQHHRVSALKKLTKWLRKTEKLKRSEDVTLDLSVPKMGASEETKDMPFELVVETFPHLDLAMRDVVQVLAATGWHVNELRRFASEGVIRERTEHDEPEVMGVIGVVHKNSLLKRNREKHFTKLVHAEHYDAAKRIRERGHLIDRGAMRKRMVKAAEAVTLERRKSDPKALAAPVVHLGSFRHSVTTWLAAGGLSDAQVAKYVGHKSEEMARKHYINAAKTALVLPRSALRVVS